MDEEKMRKKNKTKEKQAVNPSRHALLKGATESA